MFLRVRVAHALVSLHLVAFPKSKPSSFSILCFMVANFVGLTES